MVAHAIHSEADALGILLFIVIFLGLVAAIIWYFGLPTLSQFTIRKLMFGILVVAIGFALLTTVVGRGRFLPINTDHPRSDILAWLRFVASGGIIGAGVLLPLGKAALGAAIGAVIILFGAFLIAVAVPW